MTRPNILFITADQHRAGPRRGGRRIKTPHLDQLAAEERASNAITPALCAGAGLDFDRISANAWGA